jgi:hypothetical protein
MNTKQRTDVYWNPFIETNATQKTKTFSFYNISASKKLKCVVEGINGEGKLIYEEKIIE